MEIRCLINEPKSFFISFEKDGKKVTIHYLMRGKNILLHFWAQSLGNCGNLIGTPPFNTVLEKKNLIEFHRHVR